ncbi:MAG TPA: glutaminase A [Planctomycetaceae bacterium]|nr:glutaminase A [Planctomycetaceae bacterium]
MTNSNDCIEGKIRARIHPLLAYLQEVHAKYADSRDGALADYIPELSRADPNWFGISIATIDGQIYQVGDTAQDFTIQSVSKPFVYGMALQDNGLAYVNDRIGVEPSGDAFNSISLQKDSGRPFNPMINAGAIASTGLILGDNYEQKYSRLLQTFSDYVGRPVSIDESVYQSESETGDRNRAIGYMLRNVKKLDSAPEEVLDLYFRQCSILVNCRDLAVMAATLANGGVSPITGKTVINEWCVTRVLSVMSTCGMYDYSGEWIFRVGMPSKSGVGGGIIGVLPGHLGIAVFSPLLDERGNSVRGIQVFSELSEHFDLHLFNVNRSTKSVIRSRYSADKVGSKRVRPESEMKLMSELGKRITIYELQGDLTLASIEIVIRDIMALPDTSEYLIIDFKRILGSDRPALDFFFKFFECNFDQIKDVICTHVIDHPELVAVIESFGLSSFFRVKTDTDDAIEFCEDLLLQNQLQPRTNYELTELPDFDLLRGLHSEEVNTLLRLLNKRYYEDGDVIIKQGQPAEAIYLLAVGQVSIYIDLPNGQKRRLTTCSPGMAFGEMAIIERSNRSASVIANGKVVCYQFPLEAYEKLTQTYPSIKFTILENIARRLSVRVRKLTDEVRTLSQ